MPERIASANALLRREVAVRKLEERERKKLLVQQV